MKKPRINENEGKQLAARVRRVTRLTGGLMRITTGAKVSHQVIYRLLGGSKIEVEKAERIKQFLESEKLKTA